MLDDVKDVLHVKELIAETINDSDHNLFMNPFGVQLKGNIGFYATSAIAQQTLTTGTGASVDNVITALQNLGLVKQT